MTSTVRVYKSTDASAPVLNGVAGAFNALLHAVLVTGYGSSTAAGWTRPFTGTNLAAFLMGAPAGEAQRYLNVDDTGTTLARVTGYEAMTAVNTGTNPFPTAAQQSGGLYMIKSQTADATARPWLMVACERAFWLFVGSGVATYGLTNANDGEMAFGAFPSYKVGDAFNQFIMANTTATLTSNNRLGGYMSQAAVRAFTAYPGLFVARTFTQVGTAVNTAPMIPSTTNGNTSFAAASRLGINLGSVFPDPVTGGCRLVRVLECENDGSGNVAERGYLPGYWCPLHQAPINAFDTFSGSAASLPGKTFIVPPAYTAGASGWPALETSGSWDL